MSSGKHIIGAKRRYYIYFLLIQKCVKFSVSFVYLSRCLILDVIKWTLSQFSATYGIYDSYSKQAFIVNVFMEAQLVTKHQMLLYFDAIAEVTRATVVKLDEKVYAV